MIEEKIEEITQEEKNYYSKFIKDKCVVGGCGSPLEMTIERYFKRGNYCIECNSEAGRRKDKKLKNFDIVELLLKFYKQNGKENNLKQNN